MRAERLLALIFALQDHGRTTADQLATRLEVSPRTVLRDVEALSAAGVPVYTTPGPGGGIDLLPGFRLDPSALTRAEARSLPVAGQPLLADALGLGVSAQAARGALRRALPGTLAQDADELGTWFVHDPLGRNDSRARARQVREVVRAIEGRFTLVLGPAGADPLRPLGLVLAAGEWVLVHLAATPGGDRPEAVPLPAPDVALRFGARFARPEFDLTAWWRRRADRDASDDAGT